MKKCILCNNSFAGKNMVWIYSSVDHKLQEKIIPSHVCDSCSKKYHDDVDSDLGMKIK